MEVMRSATPQTKELDQLMNAATLGPLLMAIRTGRVQYQDGVFSGDFSVAISKDLRSIGATFDHRSEVYRLAPAAVPPVIKAESGRYIEIAKAAHEAMKRKLNDIQKDLDQLADKHEVDAREALHQIDKGFQKSAKLLEVQPRIDEARASELSKNYSQNLKLYIKDFSKQSIYALREAVEKNAMQGYRFDKLTETIRHRYGVTANKAKFLARQETSLFMAQYRKQRFDQAGVRKYRWSTAHDERVRDSHKHLDGQVFAYTQPPITDRATGARNNPGEDFNCRCVDVPLLQLEESFA